MMMRVMGERVWMQSGGRGLLSIGVIYSRPPSSGPGGRWIPYWVVCMSLQRHAEAKNNMASGVSMHVVECIWARGYAERLSLCVVVRFATWRPITSILHAAVPQFVCGSWGATAGRLRFGMALSRAARVLCEL